MKNIIVITGGAGFVGSNLIEYFVANTNYKIVSIDNYSSGSKKNHILNKKIKYINGHTKDINKILNLYKNNNSFLFYLYLYLYFFFLFYTFEHLKRRLYKINIYIII